MSLPSQLDFGTIKDIETMSIRSNVLDPITITSQQAVFQLEKTGILHGNSMVQLAVRGSPDLFFPPQTGIHGLIKSVFLKVGGRVIASSEEYGHYQTLMRQVKHPDHRAYVDMVKSGTILDRWACQEDGRLVPRDMILDLSSATKTARTATIPEFIRPTTSDDTTPVFSVPLSTLIPMMKSRPLPLFAIKEHIYLEINFNTQLVAGDIGVICGMKNASTDSPAVSLSVPNIKFVSDHLYFTQERMDAQSKSIFSDTGMGFVYVDTITTVADVPATGVVTGVKKQQIERKLGVSGKAVRNILVSDKPSGVRHPILGEYFSQDQRIPSELNYRINDQRVFDRDVSSVTRQYEEVSKVFGSPLMMPSQMYSFDIDTDKDQDTQPLNQQSTFLGLIEGHQLPSATNADLSSDVRGRLHYDGLDLTKTGFQEIGNGEMIGVKPILLQKTYSRTSGDDSARKLRIFCGVERQMLLKNGEIIMSA
jgi:hypothetical protein